MEKDEELLPCPFCGGPASIHEIDMDHCRVVEYEYIAECDGHCCAEQVGRSTREEAKEVWNTRKSIVPNKFYVVAPSFVPSGMIDQISVGLNTYEDAKKFMSDPYAKTAYPNAYILCSLLPPVHKQ